MELWFDSNLPPGVCPWVAQQFHVVCRHVFDQGLGQSDDGSIFQQARRPGLVVVSKDTDLPALVARHGSPPKVILVACGNVSNAGLRAILAVHLAEALRLLDEGDDVVVIKPDRIRPR
jgi:predicted nuclease of predicted toxin-antitoxin system